MNKKISRLTEIGPISYTNLKRNTHRRFPNPALFYNITTLWKILELIVQEWYQKADPHQKRINNSITENEELVYVAQALSELSDAQYLKSIFSYIVFFCSLENAYDLFYTELNKLNNESFFMVDHEKKPKRTSYISKVRLVRDISIAHIGSKKVKQIDSIAGMLWMPITIEGKIGEKTRIDDLTFQESKMVTRDREGKIIEESSDLSIKGIPELYKECSIFVDKYDSICSKYLQALLNKLPISIEDGKYESLHSIWKENK